MFWVFYNYGRTEDMSLNGILKIVADSEAQAREKVTKFLNESGYPFVEITEVQVA